MNLWIGSLLFTRPILRMGQVYKLKVCLCVRVSVITPTLPLKTLLNHFRSFTDPQNHCLVYVWWCLVVSGACLVVSDACLVVSSGVNVNWLIWPELIDVYGQIFLPVHLTDAAKMLILLMQCCCWCTVAADAADALMLFMCWCCWCAGATDALLLLICWCCWCADAAELGSGFARGPFYSNLL